MTGFNIIFLKKDKDNSYNQSVMYSNTPSDIPTVRNYFTSRELPYVDFTPPALDRSEGFIISRNHHLKADEFGVLDSKTNTMVIATGYTWPNFSANAFLPIFWIADDQGVLYNRNPKYIIDGGGIAPRIFPVPQPILLLRMPPTATQTP
jgi:hypothetical protein